jgi:2'-5' RNA ligase
MIRLFVGLSLPDAARQRLTALARGLPGARWIPPENHHLTLAFVGEVDFPRAEALAEKLAGIAHPAVEVRLSGLGLAGDAHRARTLWMAAARTPPLIALQARVVRACRAADCPAEARRFAPHVTLARLRTVDPARLQDYLTANGAAACDPFVADAFMLYSSRLSPAGSVYTEEARFPLGEAGGEGIPSA